VGRATLARAIRGPADDPEHGVIPLPSESAAMVAMTSAIIPPHKHGLVAMANGWHSQMDQGPYTEQSLAQDMHALDLMRECGIGLGRRLAPVGR
jgi:hypothetical protein